MSVVRTPEDVSRLLSEGRYRPVDWDNVRFEGFPKIAVACSEGLDFNLIVDAQRALQRMVRRVFTKLKMSKLNKRERAEAVVTFDRSHDGRRVVFDLSASLNAIMKALPSIEQRIAAAGVPLLGGQTQSGDERQGSAAILGKHAINEFLKDLKPYHKVGLLMFSVVAGVALHTTIPAMFESYLEHIDRVSMVSGLPLEKSDKLAVKTTEGKPAPITNEAQQALETRVARENRLPALLDQLEPETPLLRFARDEVENTMPHLFNVGIGGTTTINGAQIATAQLKAAAKVMRKQQAEKKKAKKEWTATVRRIQDA